MNLIKYCFYPFIIGYFLLLTFSSRIYSQEVISDSQLVISNYSLETIRKMYKEGKSIHEIKKWLKENDVSGKEYETILSYLPKADISSLKSILEEYKIELKDLNIQENDFLKVSNSAQLSKLLTVANDYFKREQYREALVIFYSILDFLENDEYSKSQTKKCIEYIIDEKERKKEREVEKEKRNLISYYKAVFNNAIEKRDKNRAVEYYNKIKELNPDEKWLEDAKIMINIFGIEVEFLSNKSGIEIFVENNQIGKTPLKTKLKNRQYNVVYKLRKFGKKTKIDLKGITEPTKINIDFEVGEKVFGILIATLENEEDVKKYIDSIPDKYKNEIIKIKSGNYYLFLNPIWINEESAKEVVSNLTIPYEKIVETKPKFFK